MGAEPETDSVLVRGATGPPVCAKCKCASTPIKRDAGRRSPSERDANERDHDFFAACLFEGEHICHGGQKLNGVSNLKVRPF